MNDTQCTVRFRFRFYRCRRDLYTYFMHDGILRPLSSKTYRRHTTSVNAHKKIIAIPSLRGSGSCRGVLHVFLIYFPSSPHLVLLSQIKQPRPVVLTTRAIGNTVAVSNTRVYDSYTLRQLLVIST